jgi:hypothetical protein
MRHLSRCLVLASLLLAACSAPFDPNALARQAGSLYDERAAKAADTFYGIRIYGQLPDGFMKTGAADGDVGCQYYRRQDNTLFDYIDVCANARNEAVIIRMVKEFSEKRPMEAFYDQVKAELDRKYYSQSRAHDTMDATTWNFKNRAEWVGGYVKYTREQEKYGRYAQIYSRPSLLETHDKLKSIRLAKESNVKIEGRKELSFVNAVSATYTSRLADILKNRKQDADYRRANEILKGL